MVPFCLGFVFLALLSEVSTFTLSVTTVSPELGKESSDYDPFLLVSEDRGTEQITTSLLMMVMRLSQHEALVWVHQLMSACSLPVET